MFIPDNLVQIAQDDLGLTYSLVCDAWDILRKEDHSGDAAHMAHVFESAMTEAILAYKENPREYVFNAQAATS